MKSLCTGVLSVLFVSALAAHAESGSARSIHVLASPAARTANCSFGWMAGFSFGPTYEDGGNTPVSASADIAAAVPYQQGNGNYPDLILGLDFFFHPTPDFYVGPRGGIFSALGASPLPVFFGGLAARYYLAPIFYVEASGALSAAGNHSVIAQIGFAPF